MTKYFPHKKQFAVGPRLIKMNEGWLSLTIKTNLYLSYCPQLTVSKAKDLNGQEWYLLGTAVQTNKDKLDPLIEIERSSTEDVPSLYKSWTGRWVLVCSDSIHTDCGGLFGCFYTEMKGERWVSSSLAILEGVGDLIPRPETLKYCTGIEWYPLPSTRFEGVYKLLPSQFLNIFMFRPNPRALPEPLKGLSYNEVLDQISERLKVALLNLSKTGKRISVALTSGYDSRLILAAVRYSGIQAETFTRGEKETSYSDQTLPHKLSKIAGYQHKYIKKTSFWSERENVYEQHVAGNLDHVVKKRFLNGQYDSFSKDDLILSGGILEVARCYYWKKMGTNQNVEGIMRAMLLEYDPTSYHTRALNEWLEWVKQTPTDGLDWRDRFYLEQRIAGWLSSIQQALDLTDPESLHITNCLDLISLFLSVPAEKRKTSEHQIDLIRKMFPGLLQYPFNPPPPKYVQIQKKVSKISKMPLIDVLKKVKAKFS